MNSASQKATIPGYSEVWFVDFEFHAVDGDIPVPVSMVAHELFSGRTIRLWKDELEKRHEAPFDTSERSLFVAFYASAEIGCFLALGWPPPSRILDLFTEFRAETNGAPPMSGNSLLGALVHHGLAAMGVSEKEEMRDLILGGGPWTASQRDEILAYCEKDVMALASLYHAMIPSLGVTPHRFGHALLRGRYMAAVAHMEHCGTPIDTDTFAALRESWEGLQLALIEQIDKSFGVYEGRTFKTGLFEQYLVREGVPWPRLDSGKLALSDDVFRQQVKAYPQLGPLRELRHALSELQLNKLAVGQDGRNRALLSPLRSKTGRNQPSNSKSIFGPSAWFRGLIKPAYGNSIAYLDWKSQEIAIAAALSGDEALWEAYDTGDPYLAFAIQAGMVPVGASKATHKDVRNRCKAIVLGVQYGMSAKSMALNARIHEAEARELLSRHKETYRTFWKWAEGNVNAGLLGGTLHTRFGWTIRIGQGQTANARSLLNWPMQANGAEMMRLACCEATEAGLRICAPIHDALLLEAPTSEIGDRIGQLTQIMQRASELVLGLGRTCGVDVDVVHYPDRYADERGVTMWETVMGLLYKMPAAVDR